MMFESPIVIGRNITNNIKNGFITIKLMFNRIWQLFVIILLITFLLVPIVYVLNIEKKPPEGFNFGVSYGLSTVSEAKLLIEKIVNFNIIYIVRNISNIIIKYKF